MKNSAKRFLSLLLSLTLLSVPVLPALAEYESDTVVIDSAGDLIELSENCTLDTWSQGKTVLLNKDIDLRGTDFLPIPTFGGCFDGQGHTISGFAVDKSVSIVGLFCYVQQCGVVQNLNVSGAVTPAGTQRSVGGIVGENSGKLLNCSFSGTVSSSSSVGGLCGINQPLGEIYDSSFSGSVTGEHFTGGIAGQSLGVLSSCVSSGCINTAAEDPGFGLEEIPSVEEFLQTGESEELVNTSTDTGGIAGYNAGMLLSCKNTGVVGYPHIGYNVGGVAGRSDGYVSGCLNSGTVMGRKDVGGVVGQMEPDIILTFKGDTLSQLEAELNTLHSLINTALDDVDASSTAISSRITSISGYTDSARDSANDLTNQTADFIDANVAEINRGSALVADTLDRLSPIIKQLEEISAQTSEGLAQTQQALAQMSDAMESGTETIVHLQDCVADIQKANDKAESAAGKISDGVAALRAAVVVDDADAVEAALSDISVASGDLAAAMSDMSVAMDEIATLLEDVEDWAGIVAKQAELIDATQRLAASMADAAAALSDIAADLQTISENVHFDSESFDEGMELISSGLEDLEAAAGYMGDALDDLELALADAETTSEQMNAATDTLEKAVGIFKNVAADGTKAISDISELTDYLAAADPIQLVQLGEDFRKSSDELYVAMNGLSQQMDLLNSEIKSSSDTLTSDMRAINDQFMVVANLFIDAIYEKRDARPSDYIEDTSDVDIEGTMAGKVLECENTGEVSGDVNVGGVTGAIAVEYDFDPEDDFTETDDDYLNSKTETKAVLLRSVNRGNVTGKKDCVGAVTGFADVGLISGCHAYGSAESTGGDYVGGIAGHSNISILNCWAKCELSGNEFVGGIVGSGKKTENCVSLVRITESVQFVGAVSGDVQGTLSGNRFVSDSLAGVDRFSFAGKAEPISYDALLQIEGLPAEFCRFSVSFIAEGKPVCILYFDYKETLTQAMLPRIPETEGCYSVWDIDAPLVISFDETVNAVYTPFETVLSSEQLRSGGQSVILAEGQFTDKSEITVKELGADALPEEGASEGWSVSVTDDGQESRFLRYQPDSALGKNAEIYINGEDGWQKVETETVGDYLRFEVTGSFIELATVYSSRTIIVIVACGFAAALAAALLIIKRKRPKGAHEKGAKQSSAS